MHHFSATYYSKLFRNYRQIPATAYHELMRYYEQNEAAILQLDFDEYFELLWKYSDALFETGTYRKYLLMADALITTTIEQNIRQFQQQDIFKHVLFRKAAAHYNLMEYTQAERILLELIRLYPDDVLLVRFLKKCRYYQFPAYVKICRAACIAFSFLAAAIICVQILVIRPIFEAWINTFDLAYIVTLGVAIIAVLGADFAHRLHIERTANAFVHSAKQAKLRKMNKLVISALLCSSLLVHCTSENTVRPEKVQQAVMAKIALEQQQQLQTCRKATWEKANAFVDSVLLSRAKTDTTGFYSYRPQKPIKPTILTADSTPVQPLFK
ncbi:MAG: hypothetical protein KA974_02495 [Saprospiraceae bacterium]|nr:hypothetical protein [Saprospiraceae bacterium]MBP7680047.1 hypothetical protein [Saprospiraceae bacterium]